MNIMRSKLAKRSMFFFWVGFWFFGFFLVKPSVVMYDKRKRNLSARNIEDRRPHMLPENSRKGEQLNISFIRALQKSSQGTINKDPYSAEK